MQKYAKNEILSDFGERIRDLRLDFGWNQKEAAEKLHLTHNQLSSYERGIAEPTYRTLLQMSKVYEADMAYLFAIQEEKSRCIKYLELAELALLTQRQLKHRMNLILRMGMQCVACLPDENYKAGGGGGK